jgi:hypothetical protein
VLREVAEDEVAILCEEGGHAAGRGAEAVPVVTVYPVMDVAALHANGCCDVFVAHICLEVEVLSLLLLCLHSWKF